MLVNGLYAMKFVVSHCKHRIVTQLSNSKREYMTFVNNPLDAVYDNMINFFAAEFFLLIIDLSHYT